MDSACPKTPITTIFVTKSLTLKFAKKLSTLAICYKGNTRPGTDLTRGPITRPTRPYPRNRPINKYYPIVPLGNPKSGTCCVLLPQEGTFAVMYWQAYIFPVASVICIIQKIEVRDTLAKSCISVGPNLLEVSVQNILS